MTKGYEARPFNGGIYHVFTDDEGDELRVECIAGEETIMFDCPRSAVFGGEALRVLRDVVTEHIARIDREVTA